jgi:hypothetical protein
VRCFVSLIISTYGNVFTDVGKLLAYFCALGGTPRAFKGTRSCDKYFLKAYKIESVFYVFKNPN